MGVFEHVNNVFFDEPICLMPNPLSLSVSTDTYAFFTGSTLRVEPESSDLFLKIVSVSVRVANLTIPSSERPGS